MAGQSNKKYCCKSNLALIVSMSSGLLIASYALPLSALRISEDSGKLIIAKTPDERQPEAVKQGIEQIPAAEPSLPVPSNPTINSPIPVTENPEPKPQSPESNSIPGQAPQPRESNSTPVQSAPQPRESNSTPVQSRPTPRTREGNSTPRPSVPTNSNPTPRPRTGSSTPQQPRGSKKPVNPARNSTPQGSSIALSNLSFKEINFVDVAFGILSKSDFRSQGRYFHFYQFEGRENQLLQIRLGGSADQRRSNNLSLNPFMFLLDPDNKVLLKRGSGGTNKGIKDAFIFVRLPAKGTYTIAVTSRNSEDTGRYSLALRNDRASYILDESAELTTPGSTLRPNGSLYNVSSFAGKKNQLVSIRVDSINEEFSPYIVLLNSQGKAIAANNDKDGTYSTLIDRARLPEDDTYYIVVTSNNRQQRGTYRLTLF